MMATCYNNVYRSKTTNKRESRNGLFLHYYLCYSITIMQSPRHGSKRNSGDVLARC